MKKIVFLAVLSSWIAVSSAQTNSFLIYSMKGNITAVENKAEARVKIGKVLNSNASLKVPAGGSVTLICNEIAMFTLKKAGNYNLTQLGDSCKVQNSSISANYLKYVWSQMTKTTAAPGSNRKMYMN